MTDKLAGKDDSQRLLGYVESVAKESRKALTLEFNEKHKGIPFNKTGPILRDSRIAWFGRRDKNLKIIAESVNSARLGEIRAVFGGDQERPFQSPGRCHILACRRIGRIALLSQGTERFTR